MLARRCARVALAQRLPSVEEAAAFAALEAALSWSGLGDPAWKALEANNGGGASARSIASFAMEVWRRAPDSAAVAPDCRHPRSLTIVEKAAFFLTASAVRMHFGVLDVDLGAPPRRRHLRQSPPRWGERAGPAGAHS